MQKYPSRDEILAELRYNPTEGTFTRKRDGAISGTLKNGYIFDSVCRCQFPRSVLVWIVETGRPPIGRLRHTEGPNVTRFHALRESKPRTKKRKWTADDQRNYEANFHRIAPHFRGLDIAERELAWAVALLS